MQYSYSKEMFTDSAKSMRIIGNPDNQRPGKWSSAVQQMTESYCMRQTEDSGLS
jgi:hypothetical protein